MKHPPYFGKPLYSTLHTPTYNIGSSFPALSPFRLNSGTNNVWNFRTPLPITNAHISTPKFIHHNIGHSYNVPIFKRPVRVIKKPTLVYHAPTKVTVHHAKPIFLPPIYTHSTTVYPTVQTQLFPGFHNFKLPSHSHQFVQHQSQNYFRPSASVGNLRNFDDQDDSSFSVSQPRWSSGHNNFVPPHRRMASVSRFSLPPRQHVGTPISAINPVVTPEISNSMHRRFGGFGTPDFDDFEGAINPVVSPGISNSLTNRFDGFGTTSEFGGAMNQEFEGAIFLQNCKHWNHNYIIKIKSIVCLYSNFCI